MTNKKFHSMFAAVAVVICLAIAVPAFGATAAARVTIAGSGGPP